MINTIINQSTRGFSLSYFLKLDRNTENVFNFLMITVVTGNNAVAVIKGHESYEVLQSSCSTIFHQVNNVIDKGKVSVEGKDVPGDIFSWRRL